MLNMSIDEPGPTGQFVLMSIVKTVTMADAPEIAMYAFMMLLCLLIAAICAGSENAFSRIETVTWRICGTTKR